MRIKIRIKIYQHLISISSGARNCASTMELGEFDEVPHIDAHVFVTGDDFIIIHQSNS